MRLLLASAAFGLLVAAPSGSVACSIPVFRYALERWRPSPYELLIYHRGPLREAERDALAKTKLLTLGANVEVTEVDLDGRVDAGHKAIWEKYGGQKPLPWAVARFPDSDLKTPLAWSGPLDPLKLKPLVESPARRRIVDSLFRGESAVFVLLESDDDKANADAAKLLADELAKLRTKIELPAPSKEGPQVRGELPVRVSFTTVRVSRKDADERAFIDLLLRCEDRLDEVKGPMVFAVFGRGRVLTAMYGKELKAPELEQVARFVCGACSCQVKELNPGIDLLFKARWEAFFEIELGPAPRAVPVNR